MDATTPQPETPVPAVPATAPLAKPLLKSKTLAVNIVIILGSFLPAVGEWVKANPADTLCLLGAVNIILRLATRAKVILWRD